jgi:hypothetical protein
MIKNNTVRRGIILSLIFSFIFPIIFNSSYSYAAAISDKDYGISNMSLNEIEE